MPTNINVPSLGESITEAVVLRWIKEDGDYVAVDDPLVELETDKTNVDIPTTVAGILRQSKKAGETVKVGETIARIEEGSPANKPAAASTSAAAPAPASNVSSPPRAQTSTSTQTTPQTKAAVQEQDLRPSVRRLVEENKLDPAAITATGPGNRIIKEDALRAIDEAKRSDGNGAPPAAAPATVPPAPSNPASAKPQAMPPAPKLTPSSALAALGEFDASGIKRVPMSKIRKKIAERLVQAQQSAAILTTINEVDMSAVMALRAKYKEKFNEVYGISLGFMSFFSRAVVTALREFPRVNAFIEGDEVIYHNYVSLGIAVSTDRGLTVPVLHHAENMSFAKIETEIKRLAAAARDGKLGLQELSGATFTITNGGIYGSLLSTPIISPPESGILGMHAIKDRPIAVNGKVEIRPMMYIALSYDHRIVDGRESVSFLVRLRDLLEDPARLMLEI